MRTFIVVYCRRKHMHQRFAVQRCENSDTTSVHLHNSQVRNTVEPRSQSLSSPAYPIVETQGEIRTFAQAQHRDRSRVISETPHLIDQNSQLENTSESVLRNSPPPAYPTYEFKLAKIYLSPYPPVQAHTDLPHGRPPPYKF